MRRHAGYSPLDDTWAISCAHFKYVFIIEGHHIPPQFASLQDVPEQGTRRGIWKMDIDQDTEADIVILK
jgi:hypothetical protein